MSSASCQVRLPHIDDITILDKTKLKKPLPRALIVLLLCRLAQGWSKEAVT